MEIFKLFGSIFVNTDDADKSMHKTEQNAESIASKLGNGVKTAAKWGAAIVTGATIAATAVTGLATNAAGTADEIDKMSQKIGISTDAYQEWSYVMGQNGMDVDKLATGMKTLVSQMDSASSGTASAQENFDKLGISIYDSSGKLKDQETILNEAMHALADMENGTEKARLATELFGKAGTEMMPMLNQGSQAMDDLTQRAHDLGLVMSEETVNAGVTLGDTIDDIKQSFTMIGTNLGSAVIPVIQQFADIIIDNMPLIQETLGALAPILVNIVSTFLPPMAELAQTLLPMLVELFNQLIPPIMQVAETIMPVIVNLLSALLPPIIQIVEAILPPIVSIIQTLTPILSLVAELLTPIIQLVASLIAPLIELTAQALTPLIEKFAQLISEALAPIIPIIEVVSKVIQESLAVAFNNLSPVIDNIMKVFTGLIDFIVGVFTGDWEKAWNGIVDIFSGIFSGIVSMVKIPLNQIISSINSVFSSLGNIKIPDWVPLVGGTTFSLPQIPMLWKGGDIVDAGSVLVGEKGPEILNLPRGARVTPLSDDNMNQTLDYNMLLKIIVEAIRMVMPEFEQVIQIVPDEDGIFRIVQKKNRENVRAGKPSLA